MHAWPTMQSIAHQDQESLTFLGEKKKKKMDKKTRRVLRWGTVSHSKILRGEDGQQINGNFFDRQRSLIRIVTLCESFFFE